MLINGRAVKGKDREGGAVLWLGALIISLGALAIGVLWSDSLRLRFSHSLMQRAIDQSCQAAYYALPNIDNVRESFTNEFSKITSFNGDGEAFESFSYLALERAEVFAPIENGSESCAEDSLFAFCNNPESEFSILNKFIHDDEDSSVTSTVSGRAIYCAVQVTVSGIIRPTQTIYVTSAFYGSVVQPQQAARKSQRIVIGIAPQLSTLYDWQGGDPTPIFWFTDNNSGRSLVEPLEAISPFAKVFHLETFYLPGVVFGNEDADKNNRLVHLAACLNGLTATRNMFLVNLLMQLSQVGDFKSSTELLFIPPIHSDKGANNPVLLVPSVRRLAEEFQETLDAPVDMFSQSRYQHPFVVYKKGSDLIWPLVEEANKNPVVGDPGAGLDAILSKSMLSSQLRNCLHLYAPTLGGIPPAFSPWFRGSDPILFSAIGSLKDFASTSDWEQRSLQAKPCWTISGDACKFKSEVGEKENFINAYQLVATLGAVQSCPMGDLSGCNDRATLTDENDLTGDIKSFLQFINGEMAAIRSPGVYPVVKELSQGQSAACDESPFCHWVDFEGNKSPPMVILVTHKEISDEVSSTVLELLRKGVTIITVLIPGRVDLVGADKIAQMREALYVQRMYTQKEGDEQELPSPNQLIVLGVDNNSSNLEYGDIYDYSLEAVNNGNAPIAAVARDLVRKILLRGQLVH